MAGQQRKAAQKTKSGKRLGAKKQPLKDLEAWKAVKGGAKKTAMGVADDSV